MDAIEIELRGKIESLRDAIAARIEIQHPESVGQVLLDLAATLSSVEALVDQRARDLVVGKPDDAEKCENWVRTLSQDVENLLASV